MQYLWNLKEKQYTFKSLILLDTSVLLFKTFMNSIPLIIHRIILTKVAQKRRLISFLRMSPSYILRDLTIPSSPVRFPSRYHLRADIRGYGNICIHWPAQPPHWIEWWIVSQADFRWSTKPTCCMFQKHKAQKAQAHWTSRLFLKVSTSLITWIYMPELSRKNTCYCICKKYYNFHKEATMTN